MTETDRVHLWISGHVQGVWYRATCRDEARAAGVAGWARNLDDGRVEVVLEGEPDAVAAVVHWCAIGPSRAHVTAVRTERETPEGLAGFTIR